MDSKIKSIEKIFNTLGKQMAKEYYDLDLNFEVTSIEEENPNFRLGDVINIKTDKPIPPYFENKLEKNWEYGRFASETDLLGNLLSFLRYLGMNHSSVQLDEKYHTSYWDLPTAGDDDYLKNPQDYIPLHEEAFVLHKPSGMVYPLFLEGEISYDGGAHISTIDSEEFYELLTNSDKINILNSI
jgi:hypothetical protein